MTTPPTLGPATHRDAGAGPTAADVEECLDELAWALATLSLDPAAQDAVVSCVQAVADRVASLDGGR